MIRDLLRQSVAALRLMLVLTVLLGIGYPLAVWGLAQPFGDRAAGQPVRVDGSVVGSRLLAQPFEGEEWFRPRPSAGDHDTLASAPSNLGPSNPDLIALIEERRAEVAEIEGVDPAEVPADAVTASGSGLDPHISPAYAALQTPRVAEARGLSVERVEELVAEATEGRLLGFHGEPAVNVVELNAALADESD